MSTDEGFRLRNGTNRPTDPEAEAGVLMEDSRPQTPEAEHDAFLNIPATMVATVAMGFLNPKKRKHIGVVQSLKAIAMSSCVFPLCLFVVIYAQVTKLFLRTSVECVCRIHTPCMGITFCEAFERSAWIDVFSYVSSS